MAKKVLVSGATGQQGGSVVRALLADGQKVIGITRNVDSPNAEALKKLGVEMVSVDFTDTNRAVELMKDVDAVFAMTTPFEAGLDKEVEQGKSMADAAARAGVQHFVFNSVGDANHKTGIPHFDSKYEVEEYLATLDLNYTIVGPTYFMDNLMVFSLEGLKNGVLAMAMPSNVKLQQISVEDIGRFVAAVIREGKSMYGKRIDIAGDEITGEEAAAVLSKAIGKEIRYEGFSPEVIRQQSEDLAIMYEWFIRTGYSTNMESMKGLGFLSFETWAAKQDWSSVK